MQKIAAVSAVLLCVAFLAGCTTSRSTAPLRTASEQLLLSAAADRAAAQLSLGIPKGTRIFVDTRYFQGYDDGYAIAAIRTQMLKNGLMLVDDRLQAEAVVQVSSGALSTDQKSLLIGLPQLTVPYIPVGNSVMVPRSLCSSRRKKKASPSLSPPATTPRPASCWPPPMRAMASRTTPITPCCCSSPGLRAM